jgi:hypothetical protein
MTLPEYHITHLTSGRRSKTDPDPGRSLTADRDRRRSDPGGD